MKKKSLTILILLISALLFASCGFKENPDEKKVDESLIPHEHEWDEGFVLVDATYQKVGRIQYTCKSCGAVKINNLPKLVITDIEVPDDYNLPYVVKINRAKNVVTIYTVKKLVNNVSFIPSVAFVCSCGGNETPLGTFYTSDQYRWGALVENSFGQYCTKITDDILFHSVPYIEYNNPGSMAMGEYNRLGKQASHGCIRLTVEDAKWIYDNIEAGTVCIIYDDDIDSSPIAPKSVMHIDDMCQWDPTDPDENNPWHSNPQYGIPGHFHIEQGEIEDIYNYDETEISGVDLIEIDDTMFSVFRNASNSFIQASFCEWNWIPNTSDGGVNTAYKAYISDFKTFAEMKAYLRQYFVEDFANKLIERTKEFDLEEDENGIYGNGGGGKGNICYSWRPTRYGYLGNGEMVMEVVTTKVDPMYDIILTRTYDLFYLVNEDDGWKFIKFSLPPWLN